MFEPIRMGSNFTSAPRAALLAAALGCGGLTVQTVLAAEASSSSASQGPQLQEIIVTATRREESLSKVPVSLTALTQDALDQKGIKDFQDIVRFTPGVTIDNSGTNAISIRGISSSGGAGTTGIYIDDTPIQMRALGFNPDDTLPKTFDVDRVEVLRGPQGTLFGSGSEGGTVRYIMTQPSVKLTTTYARSEISFTRYGEPSYEIGVAHGGPIVDDVLGFRASVWYRYDGGWIDRIDPTSLAVVDKDANHANTLAARLALLIQPKEGLKITPSLMYQNARKHDEGDFWPAYSNVDAGRFRNGTPERMPVPDEYYLPALKIEADVGFATLISNSSYYHRSELTAYQGSAYDLAYYQSQSWLIGSCGSASTTPVPPCSWYPLIDINGIHLPAGFAGYATPNVITNKQQTWTQEVRLQSNADSVHWKWTLGGFWSLSKETSTEELKDPNIIPFWQALFGIDPQTYFGPYYYCNGQGVPGQSLPDCDIYINHNIVHDRQLAGFGELTYAFNDQWSVTLGGRYAKLSFDLAHHGDGLENYGPDALVGEGGCTAQPCFKTATQSEHSFTPKASLSFQVNPDNLIYATYAKGFRPGGGNAPLAAYCDGTGGLAQVGYPNGAPLTYKSDTTRSFEVGSKNNLGRAFRIATSVYYIKWSGIQQNVYVGYNCGLQFTDNLGTAIAKGFDVQAEMAFGAGFSAEAAFGYTSARYTESTPPPKPLLVQSGDAISGEAAIDGSPGTNPPWTFSLGAQYDFSLGGHGAFVRADWEYTARNKWLAALQDPATTQFVYSAYTLSSTTFASLRAGVTLGSVQVAAFVDNLLNSHTTTNYQQSQLDNNNPNGPPPPQENDYTFRPRTVGITLTYRAR